MSNSEYGFKLHPYQQKVVDFLTKRTTDNQAVYTFGSSGIGYTQSTPTRAGKSQTLMLDIEAGSFLRSKAERYVGKHPAFSLPYGLLDMPPRRPMLYYHVQNAIALW